MTNIGVKELPRWKNRDNGITQTTNIKIEELPK